MTIGIQKRTLDRCKGHERASLDVDNSVATSSQPVTKVKVDA